MAKPLCGEVEAELAGQKYTLKLNIDDLMELDSRTGLGTLELLRSFGENSKPTNMVAVLLQALRVEGKKLPLHRVKFIVESAGFKASAEAAAAILMACLVDPTEGNASAAVEVATTPAA